MPSLNLFTSNRLEILVRELTAVLQSPLKHPLQKEIVVVQSKGMERWVSLEMARLQGICSNVSFPFPSHFIAGVFHEVVPDAPGKENPYDPGIMTWDIMRLLPPLLSLEGFEPLRRYLREPGDDLRLFELASRIADIFDHYLLFRPDMVLAWESAREVHWQATLWRAFSADKGALHPPALQRIFLNRLREGNTDLSSLPERMAVFGISALPSFHIQVIAALSAVIDVNLFLLNPCREYWGDIVSEKEIGRISARGQDAGLSPEDLYLEKGNSLLSSWGAQGRDFFGLIAGQDNLQEHQVFDDTGEETLLAAIQSDILNLRDGNPELTDFCGTDRSLRIHSCHSPLREIEVLQDQLLALFEDHADLKPSDILVMTPDIGLYAPFIQAVFSLPKDNPRWMPFSIADRGLRQSSILADHFLSLLDLAGGRLGASQVFDFLESPPVRDRFGLSEDDLEVIRNWIETSGIRWGLDAESCAALKLPVDSQNTWRNGLDRMLLGYAMPGTESDRLYMGLLPYGGIEGSDTLILERFLSFTERLFAALGDLSSPRDAALWPESLLSVLDAFFAVEHEAYERDAQAVRSILNALADEVSKSHFTGMIPLEVIKAWLSGRLERHSVGHGFLSGGVTFCAMLPMRSIPFKVICLVGMNDGAYPRESPALAFDLIARHPRPGDRSRRQDDRYLFLEAILSARQSLYISYVGQSGDDNSIRPPSVLVSELLDYVEECFGPAGPAVRDAIVTHHALQAFNPVYFTGKSPLFSYSEENCRAARQSVLPRQEPLPFIGNALPAAEEEWREIDIEDLCRFFRNPARYLLTRRLGLHLGFQSLILEETEPFALDNLERYSLRAGLTEKALNGRDIRKLRPIVSASGHLPMGTPGEYAFEEVQRSVTDFVEILQPHIAGMNPDVVDIDLTVGPFHLTGRLDSIYPSGRILYRPGDIKAPDYLRAWIQHLAMNACGYPWASHLVFSDYQGCYAPVDESGQHLESLLNIYFKGLSYPSRFFPVSSWEYARQVALGKDEDTALKTARYKWDAFLFPEHEDPAYQICFAQDDPLNEEFKRLACEIVSPALRHLEDAP